MNQIFVCCIIFMVWHANGKEIKYNKNQCKTKHRLEKDLWRWLWDLFCEENEKIRCFLYFVVFWLKTCPSPSVVVAWAGVPDCAPFAAWERCTYGTVRISEGVSGKRRDRQFSVVKGVVCHSRCAMFCAPPHLLFRKKTILFTGWCVFAEGELLTVMVRLTEFWVDGWWCMREHLTAKPT